MHARIMSQFVYKLLLFLAIGSVFKEELDPWRGRGLNRGWTKIWTKRQSHGWSKGLDLELWLEQDFDPGLTPWLEPGRVVACVPHPLHNRTQGRSVSFNPRSFILQHTGGHM